jgi:hypothetical protein
MKYKLIYSFCLISLYGATGSYLLALWKGNLYQLITILILTYTFYKVSAHWVYFAKDWIRNSLVSLALLFLALMFETPYVAFAISASYLGAAFIQIYLDEMCRNSEN